MSPTFTTFCRVQQIYDFSSGSSDSDFSPVPCSSSESDTSSSGSDTSSDISSGSGCMVNPAHNSKPNNAKVKKSLDKPKDKPKGRTAKLKFTLQGHQVTLDPVTDLAEGEQPSSHLS